jgi:hypothetical protein
MSAVGVSITVTGDGDASALYDAIWVLVDSWVDMYTAGEPYRIATSYLRDAAIPSALENNTWGVTGNTLSWMFDTFAGRRSRTAGAWAHWVQLALASEWDRVLESAEQYELVIATERPTLAALLVDAPGLVTMRNELWTADEAGLSSDTKQLALADLDADERARHETARIRCMCGPCAMLRPDASFEKGITSTLADPDAASSAAWYIARWQRVSPDVLVALVNAAGIETLRDTIERYASNLPDAAAILAPLLPTLAGVPRARAFYALASVLLDDAQNARLVHEIRVSLDGADAATEAAAEVAGVVRGGDPELYEHVAAILDRDVSEQLRHQAVLGLANAHFERVASPTVRTRLEREATRDTAAGKLASWFLASFPRKSV